MVSGEPAALSRIGAGQTVDLGFTRYQTVKGGFVPAAYAFRAMLDEQGCRFPADYNPPVHWEQLYDMEGAWDDRLHRYTRAALEKEAAKGRAYHCEALYLDPGWDTTFGSFLWGQDWLGPQGTFAQEIRETIRADAGPPLPHASLGFARPGWRWGRSSPKTGRPRLDGSRRRKRQKRTRKGFEVPAVRDGCRNLALLPNAKAGAIATLPGYAIHQVTHLNDGWYGNSRSWVASAHAGLGRGRSGCDLLDLACLPEQRPGRSLHRSGGNEAADYDRTPARGQIPRARLEDGGRLSGPAARILPHIRHSSRCKPAGSASRSRRASRERCGSTRSKSTRRTLFRRPRRRPSPARFTAAPRRRPSPTPARCSAWDRSNFWPRRKSACWPAARTASSS